MIENVRLELAPPQIPLIKCIYVNKVTMKLETVKAKKELET